MTIIQVKIYIQGKYIYVPKLIWHVQVSMENSETIGIH